MFVGAGSAPVTQCVEAEVAEQASNLLFSKSLSSQLLVRPIQSVVTYPGAT